jgi:peptidoglycan/xylan/chitin deacetylase (PgdA/CDA1 family)
MQGKFNTLVFHRIVHSIPSLFEEVSFDVLKNVINIDMSYKTIDMAISDKDQKNLVCITFDDGNISDYRIALPWLVENDIFATFFVVSDWIGSPGYLDKSQILAMHKLGMQIGSHSVSHPDFRKISTKEKVYELKKSKRIIEGIIGEKITSFSLPFGFIDNNTIDTVFECGYSYCCISRHGLSKNKSKIISRNSINKYTSISSLEKTILASISTQIAWYLEDFVKLFFKNVFPDIYILIRKFYFKIK